MLSPVYDPGLVQGTVLRCTPLASPALHPLSRGGQGPSQVPASGDIKESCQDGRAKQDSTWRMAGSRTASWPRRGEGGGCSPTGGAGSADTGKGEEAQSEILPFSTSGQPGKSGQAKVPEEAGGRGAEPGLSPPNGPGAS